MSNYSFQIYSAQLTSYDKKANVFYSHGANRSGHYDRRLFRQYVVINGSAYSYIFLSALLCWLNYLVAGL